MKLNVIITSANAINENIIIEIFVVKSLSFVCNKANTADNGIKIRNIICSLNNL